MNLQPERMKVIAEDNERITLLDHFEGQPIRFYKDKATGEIFVNADDVAKALGFKDQHDLLSQDKTLDIMNEFKKQNPNETFLREIK